MRSKDNVYLSWFTVILLMSSKFPIYHAENPFGTWLESMMKYIEPMLDIAKAPQGANVFEKLEKL